MNTSLALVILNKNCHKIKIHFMVIEVRFLFIIPSLPDNFRAIVNKTITLKKFYVIKKPVWNWPPDTLTKVQIFKIQSLNILEYKNNKKNIWILFIFTEILICSEIGIFYNALTIIILYN